MVRLQKDNESLQGKHSLHVSLQQAEDFILPEAAEVKHFEIINTEPDVIGRSFFIKKLPQNSTLNNNLDLNPIVCDVQNHLITTGACELFPEHASEYR